MNKELNDRIATVTSYDIKIYGKTKLQILASVVEELGEVASALKVHHQLVKHKTLEEPVSHEAVDLYICAIMMHSLYGTISQENLEVFELLSALDANIPPDQNHIFSFLAEATYTIGLIASSIAPCHTPPGCVQVAAKENDELIKERCLWLSHIAMDIYHMSGGKKSDFLAIANAKLDKWEANQKKAIVQIE
jgi:hypothetical protein